MRSAAEDLIISGAWFLLFGTVTSAVGVSSKSIVGENFGKSLFAKGNAIEAFGNSIQAVGREKKYRAKNEENQLTILFGSWIQAAGNTTNTVATELEIQGLVEEGHKLNAVGSVIQAIGASFEALGSSQEESILVKFEVYGNELLGLGAIFDGIGNVALINKNEALGEKLLLLGSWVQVIGAMLIVFAVTNSIEIEEPEHNLRYGYFAT